MQYVNSLARVLTRKVLVSKGRISICECHLGQQSLPLVALGKLLLWHRERETNASS